MGLAFRDLFLHFWVLGSLGSTFRVLGSLGSPFSADPADPGVGKGRQGSRFRYDQLIGLTQLGQAKPKYSIEHNFLNFKCNYVQL